MVTRRSKLRTICRIRFSSTSLTSCIFFLVVWIVLHCPALLIHERWVYYSVRKFTHAYEGWRSPQASTLHWNPSGFRKKKVGYFSNRVVFQPKYHEIFKLFTIQNSSIYEELHYSSRPTLFSFRSVLLNNGLSWMARIKSFLPDYEIRLSFHHIWLFS